jgi:hypothetical protein
LLLHTFERQLLALQLQDQRAAAVKAEADAAEAKRAAFMEMLDSKAALLEGARYSKVEALFFEDQRFDALPDANRQATFVEWQENRRRKAEDEERAAYNAKVCTSQTLLHVCLHVLVRVCEM